MRKPNINSATRKHLFYPLAGYIIIIINFKSSILNQCPPQLNISERVSEKYGSYDARLTELEETQVPAVVCKFYTQQYFILN